VSFLVFNLNVVQASEAPLAVSSNMSVKVQQEFNIQYQAAFKKHQDNYVALSSMANPYKRFTADLDWGERKLSSKEHELLAKEERFEKCQEALPIFFAFAPRAKNTTEGVGALTKDSMMSGVVKPYSLTYPFTVEGSKDPDDAPIQMALKKGWQHRGKGKQKYPDFFTNCLNIPLEIYMWEDEELEDESDEAF
jgi:hypothetical protein